MTATDRLALEQRLKGWSYAAIDPELRQLPSGDLIDLLDSKAGRIGDTAAQLLCNRREARLVADALLKDSLRRRDGRVRALYVLNVLGRDAAGAIDAYQHCLHDRVDDVVGGALFGIVFMRERRLLPELQHLRARARPGSGRRRRFDEAISALEANDPHLFNPGFYDAANVWRLNEPA